MIDQFNRFGIPQSDVTWITSPNKGDAMPPGICTNTLLTPGQISCTYKHYLALNDIVEQNHSYAVILEDNIEFRSNVPKRLEHYLLDLPSGWDTVFDSDILFHYIEGPVSPFTSVYSKSIQPTAQCAGGSKGANFILVNQRSARLLRDTFLPFGDVSDHWYNHLLRVSNMKSYWTEPPNVHKIDRPSTWK
jgi:GR25 family glycosyltransferase involved in LPS biosynthesis